MNQYTIIHVSDIIFDMHYRKNRFMENKNPRK